MSFPITSFVRIVECPLGAYPASCLPYYVADYRALAAAFDSEPLVLPRPTAERRRLVEAAAAVEPEHVSRHRFARSVPSEPSDADVMAVCLAREYTDESICSAGAVSPLAMTSYLLARRTHAPGLTLITTSGGYVDVAPRPMLLGLGEALDYKTAVAHASGDGTYHRYYQSGRISHETVATAQVDRFGRTNTIEVRSPSGRVVRLPGQGGMADVANMHQHFLLYVTRHSPLALVESVDVSSAGRGLLTDEERLAAGLRPGVVKVVTNLCIFELDHVEPRAPARVAPSRCRDRAMSSRETGFEFLRSPSLARTEPPSAAELELIASEIDPLGIRHLEFVPARERGAFLEEIIAAEERLVDRAGRVGGAWLSAPRVLVVGAGLMGSQIGCEYSLGGHPTAFLVRDVGRSRARVSSAFAVAVEAGLAGNEAAAEAQRKMAFVETVSFGRRSNRARGRVGPRGHRRQGGGPRRVSEAAPGRHDRLEHLDDPFDRARRCDRRARADGRHPLLEPSAADAARRDRRRANERAGRPLETVSTRLAALGKEPVHVERDVPGFIWNRLQAALLRESLWLVGEGVATPETVDRIVRSGLGEAVPLHGAVRDGRPRRRRLHGRGSQRTCFPSFRTRPAPKRSNARLSTTTRRSMPPGCAATAGSPGSSPRSRIVES